MDTCCAPRRAPAPSLLVSPASRRSSRRSFARQCDRSNVRILDCGCGTGANLDLLNQLRPRHGFDLTETGLRFSRERRRTAWRVPASLPRRFPDGAFDLVTSFDVISLRSEAGDERAALAEMFRLLQPGGHAIINVAAMEILRGRSFGAGAMRRRRYDRAGLHARLTAAGFSVVRLTYYQYECCRCR